MNLDERNTIPLGSYISWAGLISIPTTLYWGISQLRKPSGSFNRFLAGCLRLILLMSVLWWPISCLLAGNLSFTFHENGSIQGSQMAMDWFWRLSFGIVIGTIFVLVSYWLSLLRKKLNS